ncbi:MAG: hypothetical protein ACREBC_04495, partial [Pyrinomonadaceae bacterium]
ISSVIAQEGVNAKYSGSLIVERKGRVAIEGVSGYGTEFMLGSSPESLPKAVEDSVMELYGEASRQLGAVRFEWVYDGETSWIVQLHKGATSTLGTTIYPGEAKVLKRFDVREGIESLRKLIPTIGTDEGITIVGDVGVTSHLGDLLRRARVPSRIEPQST